MAKMRVFADYHHDSLYLSLHLLFEKRLDMELYRPIGADWFTQGYWKIAQPYENNWQTVNQYLSVDQRNIPVSMRLNKVDVVHNGVYEIGLQRAIELETFKHTKFDYIIASIPDHFKTFKKLRIDYQPQAKLICHIGNAFNFPWNWVDNVLCSAKYEKVPDDVNIVFYHQEFPLEVYKFEPVRHTKVISSLLHLFPRYEMYPTWIQMMELMPDWTFKRYGVDGLEPHLDSDLEVAEAIHNSDIVAHFKEGGDGFGHIVHNVFACGRVLLTKEQYYKGKMAFDLMLDGETCLLWHDDKSIAWNIDRIKSVDLGKIGLQAYNRFLEVVNYDKEELEIRKFLERAT